MTEARKCVSCGAPIEVGAHKCAYCGMTYEPEYWAGYVKYIPIRTERMKMAASVEVPSDTAFRFGEMYTAQMAKREITEKIAEGLSEVMKYKTYADPIRDVLIVNGEIWVEKPSAYY